jgi:hypothetical protein
MTLCSGTTLCEANKVLKISVPGAVYKRVLDNRQVRLEALPDEDIIQIARKNMTALGHIIILDSTSE